MKKEEENIVQLPEDGVIDTAWAAEQLERASLFSSFGLNANKGRVFFMLKSNLDINGYEQSVSDLEYTTETAEIYIRFLEKLSILEAIRDKYFTALSLSASELIPDNIEDAMALLDICIARVGKPTAKNLAKALDITGKTPKKMSDSAITVEALKKKALHDWLLSEHQLSDDDILNAGRINTAGKTEYLEKMLQAFALLGDWKTFYDIIAVPVHASDNLVALRFLADMQDSAGSIQEYLASEKAFLNLQKLKEEFTSSVYPKLSFEASK